ncbi:MAG: GH25 family lysozyme [Blautia massiliensis (ex Durand et al. 2017)]
MRLSNGEVLLRWPLNTHIITAGWTYNDGSAHKAIDLRASVGTPVYASEPATVNLVQYWDGHTLTGDQSYGNLIRLRHSDYNGKMLETYYAHLSKICVASGQTVTEGQLIGYSGETGNCDGAHLHFEVRVSRVRYNPLSWLDANFSCANDTVKAHLGEYTSVDADSTEVEARPGVFGIDVSKYQGVIDWKAVAADGVKYAILRVGSSTNAGPYVDPYFESNYNAARAAGLRVGAYLFTYATSEQAQNAELEVWLPALEGKTFDYPVFVDVEDASLTGLERDTLTALTKRMMDILDQRGYLPGWYSYTNYINSYLNAEALAAYPLWVADYREPLGYTGEYMMWQYTSTGRVAGISGDVDCNWDYSGICDTETEQPVPPVELQRLCVISPSEALINKAQSLQLPVQTATAVLIGPASNGDAMTLWMQAQGDGTEYFARYTNQ